MKLVLSGRLHSDVMMLFVLPEDRLREDDREAFKDGLAGYREAMLYNADLAPQRYNLGNLATNRGEDAQTIIAYEKAIDIDERFYPSEVNLAINMTRQVPNHNAAMELLQYLER